MATRSEAWEPEGGWDRFSRADDVEELAWEVLAGWHYINPTATTSVWESPDGATVYLAFDDSHALIELVIGHGPEEDADLQDFTVRLRKLGLRPSG
ncbi:MAG: hypothetical protein ACRBN8_21665 [Nannocystales bacterium]